MKPHLPLSLRKALYAAMALSCAGAFAYSLTIPAPFLPADLVDSATETVEELSLPAVLSFTASPPLSTAASPAQPSIASATSTPAVASAEPASAASTAAASPLPCASPVSVSVASASFAAPDSSAPLATGVSSSGGGFPPLLATTAYPNGSYSYSGNSSPQTNKNTWVGYQDGIYFKDNHNADDMGGAIYNDGFYPSPTPTQFLNNGDILFLGNKALDGGAIAAISDLEFIQNGDISFLSNTAYDGDGGAIYGDVLLRDCGDILFRNNRARLDGGAIDGVVSISSCDAVTFSSNSSSVGFGGAIFLGTTINDCDTVSFSDNSAGDHGGALFGATTINNCGSVTFSSNSSKGDGGAIYMPSGTTTISSCNTVTFSGNSARHGGAIRVVSSDVSISDCGTVIFRDNSADDLGGAISGETTISGCASVVFSDNCANINGGAISGRASISDCDSVTFSGNRASSTSTATNVGLGGAIYGGTTIISGCGDVIFRSNGASGNGGAIGNNNNNVVATISDCDTVVFSGNRANRDGGAIYAFNATIGSCNTVTFSDNSAGDNGGAILNEYNGTTTISDCGTVTFSGNCSSQYGGAIETSRGTTTIGSCDTVIFSGNSALYGGVINASYGAATISDCGTVVFRDNRANCEGGAICTDHGTTTISSCNTVTFSGNQANDSNSYCFGGAISGRISISSCNTITFRGNSTDGSGGAISGATTIDNCETVTFSGNSARYGGAILNEYNGTTTISDCGTVIFSGNRAAGFGNVVGHGGAIYSGGAGSRIIIQGSALFEKNIEIYYGSNYRLRSIHQQEGVALELSAASGKSIEFRDSIYSGASSAILNRDYAKSDGSTQRADGTIRFTGATAAADLAEMKGSAGTTVELTNSLTSVITGQVQLMGGTLAVEDGAILQVGGLITTGGASAGIVLHNGTLSTLDEDDTITLGSGSVLSMSGTSTLSGTISTAERIQAHVDLSAAQQGVTQLGLYGNLLTPGIDLTITGLTTVNRGVYVLLDASSTLTEGQKWQDIISLNADDRYLSRLVWDGNRLLYDCSNIHSYTYRGSSSPLVLTEDRTWQDYEAVRFENNTSGAINDADGGYTATFSGCGTVAFDGNSSGASGGAIHATVNISGCDEVIFSDNSAGESGGAIAGRTTISDCGTVTFSDNGADEHGGAISGKTTISGCDAVTFSDNSATESGGAIWGRTTISECGEVTFSGNSTNKYGGAISGNTTISACDTVIFSDNHAGAYLGGGAICGDTTISDCAEVTFSGNSSLMHGGAIESGLTISGCGEVTFSDNSATYDGGAIYSNRVIVIGLGPCDGYTTISDCGEVTFSGNSATNGGAICVYDGRTAISACDTVTFSDNRASMTGGAIDSTTAISDCGTVTFSGNSSSGYGGAIDGNTTMSDCGTLTFSGNSSGGHGGAIEGNTTISACGTVTFSGNRASMRGGAIAGTTTISDCDAVTFSGNSSGGYGGAIYGSEITIQGSALFEKNTEFRESGGSYRLRSIYQGEGGTLELSAASGKSIEFRDSIYSGASSVILNRDYAKSDGSMQRATGTIRFTGRYTAADLAEMKGSAGTAAELTNSLTSVITGQVQLMGGTLSIEDGAILQVGGLITTDDAPADLMLHNGTLSTLAEDGAITLGSGSILTMSGTSSLSGAVSTVEHIQATVDLSLAQQGVAQLGLYGSLVTPGIDLTITGLSPMNRGVYVLLDASATLAEGQHWQDIISVNVDESLASQLMWDGNRLIFDSRRSYNYIGNSASQHEQSVWEFFDAGIRFEDNHVIDETYEDGGALTAAIDPIRFSDNGDILFRNNSLVDGSGGAIHAGDSLTFSTNGDIAFIGNSTQSDSYSGNGGALYVRYSLNFTDNGTVLFNENSLSVCADAHGGAIYAHSSVDFTGNSVVNFGGNSAISRFGNACGGAIDAGYAGCSLGFSSNGSIIFQVNRTESPSGYSHGGAIYAGSSLSFNHNGNILFDGNSATGSAGDTCGGAIYTGGWMDWSHNGEITFRRNSANYGGAIFAKASGTSNFIGNGDIAFRWNLASGGELGDACGGAIELDNDAALSFSGNGNIVFEGNLAVSPSDACGAAIHTGMNARVDVNGNGDITFLGNAATGSGGDACGGALMADDQSHLTFTDNGDITFAGNAADTAVEGGEARGGAIVVEEQSRLVFRDNTELRFSGNRAAAAVAAYGGAIYGGSGSQLTIQGSALLERNVELTYGSEARLRSIYQEDGGDFIELSAASGKSIEVRDSIYSGANYVIFNANYLKSDGSVQTADGTIRFTGKYTAADLAAAKGEAVSAAEVANSRTSEFTGEVRLMNGTLSVEDGAVLKVGGLYAMAGSTLALSDATLDAGSAEVNLNSGTTLALKGANSINASSLVMEGGSTLSFRLATGPNAEAPLMALSGNLQTGSLNVVLENARLAYGTYKLLTLADGNAAYDWAQSWTEEKIHVQDGAQFGDFVWRDGSLYVSCHEGTVWESSSGVWESSNTEPEAGKLVFTNEGAGSVTLSGTVTAETVLVQNDIDNNYTWTGSGSLTGDTLLGKNGEGTLRIETANSYSGGTVISGGTLEAAHTEALGCGDVSLQAGTLVVAAGAVNNKVEVSQDATVAFGENSSAVKGTVTATADGVSLNPGELRYDADSQTLTVQGAQGHTLVLRDVLVDMAAGTVLRMENVTLTSSARLTDDTATLLANGLTVEVTSANARLQEGAQALSVSSLTACGREVSLSGQDTVWPDEGSTVCVVTLTNISDYDITGSSLHFDLSGYEAIEGATSGDYVSLVFESATMDLATLTVTADILGRTYTGYYDSEQPKGAVYFDLSAVAVPEPASSALALLGLAALAARRRRRS